MLVDSLEAALQHDARLDDGVNKPPPDSGGQCTVTVNTYQVYTECTLDMHVNEAGCHAMPCHAMQPVSCLTSLGQQAGVAAD